MERDIKDVIGVLMRALDGGEVSHEDLDDLGFEADGELQTTLNEAYVKLREFANDRELRLNDPKMDRDMREKLQAQADIETQSKKVAAEIALAERKFELERELKLLDHQLKTQERQSAHLQAAVAAGGDGQGASALVVELMNELKRINAPKRIVRDDKGRAIGVEPVTN